MRFSTARRRRYRVPVLRLVAIHWSPSGRPIVSRLPVRPMPPARYHVNHMQRHVRALVVAAALGAAPGWAANSVSVVSTTASGNFHAGGVVLTISGDDNGNAAAGLEVRETGASVFKA